MTHPDLTSILLGCFMFFAFLAFVIANMMLAAKRIYAWFERRSQLRYPPSVTMTLNQMNVSEDVLYRHSRHAGDKHA
jgi:hypothetical protein